MISWWKRFRIQQNEVDRALRAATPPEGTADATLHDSIMRAVRVTARQRPEPKRVPGVVWWLSGAVAASIAATTLWLQQRPAVPTPQKMAVVTEMAEAPAAAMNLGAQAPALLMAPLTNEMARVDQDVHAATALLLESFP